MSIVRFVILLIRLCDFTYLFLFSDTTKWILWQHLFDFAMSLIDSYFVTSPIDFEISQNGIRFWILWNNEGFQNDHCVCIFWCWAFCGGIRRFRTLKHGLAYIINLKTSFAIQNGLLKSLSLWYIAYSLSGIVHEQ